MNPITPAEICAMTDREGLIPQGCGDDLNAFYNSD